MRKFYFWHQLFFGGITVVLMIKKIIIKKIDLFMAIPYKSYDRNRRLFVLTLPEIAGPYIQKTYK